jgi:ribonuclease BN (tRNA processing enzyme)
MNLVLLGTGGYFPTACRQTSCFYFPDHGVAVDAGTGLARLAGFPAKEEYHIFLTHGHLDHTAGLVFLPGVLDKAHVKRVTLWGEEETTREVLSRLFGEPIFSRTVADLPFEMSIRSLEASQEIEGLRVEAQRMPHGIQGSASVRLTDPGGASAVVLTDTHASSGHASFCRDAGVLLADSYFRSDQEDRARASAHSTPRLVAQLAKAAGVRRLLLIHVNPLEPQPETLVEEARQVFPNTFLGRDEMRIEVKGE